MTLQKYREKRAFSQTPEPHGKAGAEASPLVFCVQKHDARNLHYDFRLEHKGVLLSWAIPKGPSSSPSEKRLAIHVEDHPMEYRHFEGVIPKGNYGAGTVELWDEGTYCVEGEETKGGIEKAIEKGLKKGHLKFILYGKKLQGAFSLIKIKSEKDNQWLFIKSDKSDADSIPLIRKNPPTQTAKSGDKAKKMWSSFIKPMLCTLIAEPFDGADWLFEIKLDGYRTLAYIDKKKVKLYSRNENDFTQAFPSIVKELSQWGVQAILDGEMVILDKKGKSDFQLMQNYQKTFHGSLYYYVFDLLYLNGKDMRHLPLIKRKEELKNLLADSPLEFVRFNDHVEEHGIAFFEKAKKFDLEGIIAKKQQSSYVSKRSHEWLKIKTHRSQEAIICGFTAPKGSRKEFGSLILGVYDEKKKLIPIGLAGTGFTAKSIDEIYLKMKPLIQTHSPFDKEIKTDRAITWINPQLICEVSFSQWTKDGVMRHPTFEGLRQDKASVEVKREKEKEISIIAKKQSKATKEVNKLKNKSTPTNPSVGLSHPDKIYWPSEGYTKQDLMDYYVEAAPYILPFLRNRPAVLRRFPNGIEGESFIQKDIGNLHLPEEFETVAVQHEERTINYLLIQNEASLKYAVNLGTIEFHPFHCQIKQLDAPDYFVLDLDPESVPFPKVIEVAQIIHQLFEEKKIPHYGKTSGGRGFHIYIPLHAQYTEIQVSQFGELLATLVHEELPAITSLERSPKKRQKKIYLDVLQNRSMQTIVAPYSVRGRPGATVSAPIEWKELHKSLSPQDFTIKTMPKRLKKIGDIFMPILEKKFDLRKWTNQ